MTKEELAALLENHRRMYTEQFVVDEVVLNGVAGFRARHKESGLSMQAHDLEPIKTQTS